MSLTPDLEKGYDNNQRRAGSSSSQEYDPQTLNNKQNYDHTEEGAPSELLKVRTSTNGDIVYLGHQAFKRSDLENAFSGTLNPGIHPAPHRPMGNPVPIGLSGFCICCFVVSMVNVQARGVTNVNIIASSALFFGGVIEAVAGFWCLLLENTFAATALASFGGFWLGYGAILIDGFGITSSYKTTEELNNALGLFLAAWFIFAFLMWLCTFKATWPFFLLFLGLWLFILLLSIGYFVDSTACIKAGGAVGLIATFIGFFIVFAGTVSEANSYVTIPPMSMPGAPRV